MLMLNCAVSACRRCATEADGDDDVAIREEVARFLCGREDCHGAYLPVGTITAVQTQKKTDRLVGSADNDWCCNTCGHVRAAV